MRAGALEGELAGYQHEQDDPAGPDIDGGVVDLDLLAQDLGAHVAQGAPVDIRIEPVSHATDAKICDFDYAAVLALAALAGGVVVALGVLDHDVLQFEVSMDDASSMAIPDPVDDLPEVLLRLFLLEVALFLLL